MREGRQIRFLFLPDGEDPDSLVRQGRVPTRSARAGGDSLPLSDYLLDELRRQAGSDSLDGRARLAELARPLLALLPAGVYRELLTDRLAAGGRPQARAAGGGHGGSDRRGQRALPRPGAAARPSPARGPRWCARPSHCW